MWVIPASNGLGFGHTTPAAAAGILPILVRNDGKHKSETSFEHIRASTTVYIITNSFRIQCVFIIFFGSHASPFKTNPVKVNLNVNADATIKAYYKIKAQFTCLIYLSVNDFTDNWKVTDP